MYVQWLGGYVHPWMCVQPSGEALDSAYMQCAYGSVI